MIRIPNIVLNITTGLFAGIGAYTGNYWYLCGSAVCIAIYYYHKWENKKNDTEETKDNDNGELLTDEEEKQVWEEFQGKVEDDEDSTSQIEKGTAEKTAPY